MNCDISPEKLVLLATQVAIEISKGKSIDEINLARNIASQISASLQVIVSQKLIIEKNEKSN